MTEKYKIDKCTAMATGDREYEILGGKASGIKTCIYNTDNVELTGMPDFYIGSLQELHDIEEL